MIKPGIYDTMTNEEYHADSATSRSGIMMFNDSPHKYWANYINPARPKKESTKAMDFGSAFHTFVLEPEVFGETYAMMPEKILLKDVGRESYEAYKNILKELELDKKIFLSSEEMTLLFNMRQALVKHSDAWQLIEDAIYEQSYFWQDKDSGLMVKCRPDILHSNMIVDLKTCASASSRSYQRTMIDSGYHVQGAMIRDGVRETTGVDIPNVVNICVEKTYPYAVAIKIISTEALEAGSKRYKNILMRMRESFDSDSFPGYEIEEVGLPAWAM